ncbi:MAG: hypothetical protein IJR40_09265 [Treponema sp.]|nr:hypothetical protein [Treponema sp.]
MSLIDKKNLAAMAIFAAGLLCLKAEVFRTRKTVCLNIPARGSSESKACGINDCLAVKFPADSIFIQGVEITVKIPQAVANYRNTILYSLYSNVSPVPTEKGIDYSGTEIYSGLYPGQLSWSIAVPLIKGNTIKSSPYADKTLIAEKARGFVLLRNQLAMKGVPQSVLDAEFEVSAKAILTDFGALKVNVGADAGEYTVYVDEKPAAPNESGLILLKPGKRSVSVVSDKFRNESRSVMIEQAQISELNLDLQSVAPAVRVRAPEGTKIFVDGNEVQAGEALDLEAGEHLFKFNLGGYEVTKKVTIQNGKSYNVSVNVDASVKEE